MSDEKKIDSQTQEFIDMFVSEGNDLLDGAESKISFLDKEYDEEIVNTVFRMFHSIKGSAGFLNFENIQGVTHEAETMLDIIRKDKAKPGSDAVDLLYLTCDFLRQLISGVQNTASDGGYEDQAHIVIHDIKTCIANLREDLSKNAKPKKMEAQVQSEKPEQTAPAAEVPKTAEEPKVKDEFISNELIERFAIESADLLERVEKDVIALEKDPNNTELIHDAFRAIHTFKGNAGFFEFKDLEETAADMETFFETLRYGRTVVNGNVISFLLTQVDMLENALANTTNIKSRKSGGKKEAKKEEYKPIGEILVEHGDATREQVNVALEKQQRPIGQILVEDGGVSKIAVDNALEAQSKTQAAQSLFTQRKEIRVSTTKMDQLFELVGELITSEAMVTHSPDLEGLSMPRFNKSATYLSKITRELQEVTMSIRMIPLEGLFSKMERLVRDLSRKSGKTAVLSMVGSETEMDRNLIEEISDPLVHLIRNSLDHGIETPEERKKSGKAEQAVVELSARYEGNEIWIIVKDDGRGLSREKILKKAVERGIAHGNTELLTDGEVWRYIFEPGFSTADKVTDISGRCVGMDVVKRNIEKLRGAVDIKSELGKGTSIVLRIPLTMAILDGITVKIGKSFYSIPTVDIIEFFKAEPKMITKTQEGHYVVKLREHIIPVAKLWEIFGIEAEKKEITEGILLLAKKNGKSCCLLIDEIVGSQQIVIKSLGEYLGKVNGITGCSVTGSGDVTLIVDTGMVMNKLLN